VGKRWDSVERACITRIESTGTWDGN